MNIYDFDNLIEYLNHEFDLRKMNNPSFSLGAWAKIIGFKTHTQMYEILNGKRKFPLKYFSPLANVLKLNNSETEYLGVLISLHRAEGDSNKSFFLNKLQSLKPFRPAISKTVLSNEYFESPIHAVIFSLSFLKDFKQDVCWIKERIIFDCSDDEIQRSLLLLNELGVFNDNNISIHPNTITKVIRPYTLLCHSLFERLLPHTHADDFYSSDYLFVAVNKDQLEVLRSDLIRVTAKFRTQWTITDNPDRVYGLGFITLPLTK